MQLWIYDRPGLTPPEPEEPSWLARWAEKVEELLGGRRLLRPSGPMELAAYARPLAASAPEQCWRPGWLIAFEEWAQPAVAPEREEEQERSFLPVGLLLGLALAVQYAQLWIEPVRSYLMERNFLFYASWATFTICKQWILFVLMLLALRIKEDRLAGIGFPSFEVRRLTLALALFGFFLGAALVGATPGAEPVAIVQSDLPLVPFERVLFVLLAATAAIVEESFFRGFAIVWTYRWSGQVLLAVLLPALVFAGGHAYRGWLNVVFAFVVALGFSALFLWRRNLYWPMVIHFIVNVRDLVL